MLQQPNYWLQLLRSYRLRRRFAKCGQNFIVYGKPHISYPSKIQLGDNVILNHSCELNATLSSIVIGNNCTISAGAKILAATYDVNGFFSNHTKDHISKPVYIGDDVWICAGAIICPGVRIVGGGNCCSRSGRY